MVAKPLKKTKFDLNCFSAYSKLLNISHFLHWIRIHRNHHQNELNVDSLLVYHKILIGSK